MNATSNVRHPEKLALLVGSNPLPNYLAATVLQPKEVVLLHSPETREPRDRLETAFKNKGTTVSTVCIEDATDVRKIRDACQSLQVDHLHYSGGTKPMAAHTRAMFGLGEAQEARASYLDERKGLLRFDDGYEIRLAECDLGLTLDHVLALHGIKRIGTPTTVTGGPNESDVDAVRSRVFAQPELSRKLYEHFRPQGRPKSLTEAKTTPWKASDHDLNLTATTIPDPDSNWTKVLYEAWEKFLTGGWLERWTAGVIRSCLGASTPVEIGVVCQREKATKFEIDVALIRGHRLYVVSCTTAHKKALCKSKLFEVAMRALQMGGDLARSALVCLLDGDDGSSSFVDQLESDIASVWDAPNVPRVFGLADLREWAGTCGAANTDSLIKWLDS